jgi:hypothetical protein
MRSEATQNMAVPVVPVRHRAVAMELAVYLDEQYVEMHVRTDTGKTITVVCDKASIFSLQQHIEQIGHACPEISAWKSAENANNLHGNDRRAYEAAMWEGWPALPFYARSPRVSF